MIKKIYSNLSTFKTIKFKSGLNIIVADKTKSSTQKQTRNGAGKTSIIDIIHFLLGSSVPTNSIFRSKELIEYSFSMDFTYNSDSITVTRSGKDPSKIYLDHNSNVVYNKVNIYKGYINNKTWKNTLSILFFNIEDDILSFRSIISYFIRMQNSGGFSYPTKFFSRQRTGSEQITLSYLLGLDYLIPYDWELLREEEKKIRNLKKSLKNGALNTIYSSAAEIQTQITLLEDDINRIKRNIKEFRVLPQYRELENELNSITKKISDLNNENFIDKQHLLDIKKSIQNEETTEKINLSLIYKEVKTNLPENIVKHYSDVEKFHKTVISNRKMYLESEINTLDQGIENREISIKELSDRQRELMTILNTSGAIEQYSLLQSELNKIEAQYGILKDQLENITKLEQSNSEFKLERNKLLLRLKKDHFEQFEHIKKAILSFSRVSSAIYESIGQFTTALSENGPKFDISIPSQRSKGINNMQIFCFDIMLMEISKYLNRKINFLIHDSHLFDGVDSRQIFSALSFAMKKTTELDFQYIVTMNSDIIEDASEEIKRHILPVRLTDETDDGGLFGFRF